MAVYAKQSIQIAASPCESHPWNEGKKCPYFNTCRDERLACGFFNSYVSGTAPIRNIANAMPNAGQYDRCFKETWTVEDEADNDGA